MNQLGNTLKSLRNQNGYSQQQIADAINVKVKTYQAWENRNIEPSLLKLSYLADLYGTTLTLLLNDENVKSESSLESKYLMAAENIKNAIRALLDC